MKIQIKDIILNYEVSGVGPPLLFLHGWGCDLRSFDKIKAQINEDFTVYQLDLPGFGLSEIKEPYSISYYAEIVYKFCLKLKIINPTIVGHSFGGRIAIMYASKYKVDKLVLVASPGVKERFNLIKWFKIKIYKIFKRFNLKPNMGSTDYKNASILLKEVLVKAVNYDLTLELGKIKCETLLIYGKKDRTVKPYVGKKIKSKIENSGIVFLDCAHFPFVEKFRTFLIILKSFIYGKLSWCWYYLV